MEYFFENGHVSSPSNRGKNPGFKTIDCFSGLQVANANAVECLTLAGLDELVFDDDAGVLIDNNTKT